MTTSENKFWGRLAERAGARFRAGAAHPAAARALKLAQYALFAGVVAYLIYRLSQVGWMDVLAALPESPWFYIFFALRFLVLPVSEMALYEILWSTPLLRHFFVFVRKRVYNFAVVGYSGEAFFTLWARRRLNLSDKKIIVGVKDNALLSAFTSNSATVILIIALAATGGLSAGLNAFPGAGWLFALAFGTAATLAVVVGLFHRRLIAAPPAVLRRMMGVHTARVLLVIILHAAMYAAAIPGAPLLAWVTFIALQLVMSRIPFLPNQDIVYLTAALAMSSIVGAPEAAVAGMLVAEAGLSQIANAILFAATAPLARTAAKAA